MIPPRTIALAACTVALALPTAASRAELAPEILSRIDALAAPMIEKGVAVGFVIGVLDQGSTTILPYGETVRGSGRAPDGDTFYEIGSITKVFTSLLLADAVGRDEVALTQEIQTLLPPEAKVPVRGTAIQLVHLATHTSGLPGLPANFAPADITNPYADYTVQELHDSFASLKLARAPGTYEYSNYGMGLLGHLLVRRTGAADYESLLRQRVLEPLSLRATTVTLNEDQRRRLAAPYAAGLGPAKNWDLPTLAGAGALRSTAADMLRFAAVALADDEERPLAAAFELSMEKRQAIGDGLGIGLGWHFAGDGVTRWHDGGTGGYRSWFAVIPGRDLAVVVLANTADERIGRFGENVTRAAAGMAVEPQEIRTEIELDPTLLATYVGSYQIAPTFALEVTLEGKQLMVKATGQEAYPIFATAPGEFFYKVVDAQLSFLAGADGKVTRVVLHQGGRDIEGQRKQ